MSNSHIEMCGLAGDTEKLLEEAVDEDGVSLLGLGEMDDDEENDLNDWWRDQGRKGTKAEEEGRWVTTSQGNRLFIGEDGIARTKPNGKAVVDFDPQKLGETIQPLGEKWKPLDESGQPDVTKTSATYMAYTHPQRDALLMHSLDSREATDNYLSKTKEWYYDVHEGGSVELKKAASELLGRSDDRGLAEPDTVIALDIERELSASYVRKHFGEEVVVLRGVGKQFMETHPDLKAGDVIEIETDSLSSWTTGKYEKFATQFARNIRKTQGRTQTKDRGAVLAMTIKPEDVFMVSDLSDVHHLKFMGDSGKELVVGRKGKVQVTVQKVVNCVNVRADKSVDKRNVDQDFNEENWLHSEQEALLNQQSKKNESKE